MLMHIAFVLESGEIQAIVLPKGANNISEGYYDDGKTHVVYIDFEISNKPLFMETHYYNFDTSSFVSREPKPNPVAYWLDGSWVWDVTELLGLVRQDRDLKLSQCDWTQMPDSPLTATQKTAWADYRQALRDLPQNVGEITSLADVVWPIPPN